MTWLLPPQMLLLAPMVVLEPWRKEDPQSNSEMKQN